MRSPLPALALGLAALASGGVARAQVAGVAPPPSPLRPSDDEARRLFEQAMPLLGEQRFAEAVPLLEASISRRENPAALAALAAAYRGVGRYLRATSTLERLLAITTDAAREAEVRAVLGECRAALAHVALRVVGEASEVLVDGDQVATGDLDRALDLDPGMHRFEARRAGYEPARVERRVALGERVDVAIDASARPMPATLVVETPDATTTIRVDGVPVGRGRTASRAASGRHAVQVSWDDGHTQERVVELSPGARMVVSIAPNRRASTSIVTRWWFWTAVGAATVGLVVGGIALASGGEQPAPLGSWGHVSNAITLP